MATIKIDRGFTQKIQQKGLVHSPSLEPSDPHRNRARPGARKPPVALFVAGGFAALAAVVGIAVALTRGSSRAPAQAAPAAPAAPAPAPPAAPAPQADSELPPDPDAELYARHSGQPAPQPAPQQPPAGGLNIRPVWRDRPVGGAQGLRCEYFENISGKPVSAIRAAPAFPGAPSRVVQVERFELSEDIADHYGVRVRGFLVPPASGAYTFSAVGDDGVELWLSADDTTARVRRLVGYENCVSKGQWTARGDQQSPPCELVAGQRYYLEAFLKENTGHDHFAVAWKGPVSDRYAIIEGRYLQPWEEAASPAPAAAHADPGEARRAREAALAPARESVEAQRRNNASLHRYAQAADALKAGKAQWTDPAALELVETAILRFELLARLRAAVQAELAKAPARGVWTAFGGQADVTAASDEGVTVAPGRIVAWPQVPADQLLKLVNATIPKIVADPSSKGVLFVAAAVYCKEVAGGLELALKYRERALAQQASLAALADRVLGGAPETLQAEARIKGLRDELAGLAPAAAALAEQAKGLQEQLAAIAGLVPGLLLEYWENNPYGSLADVRKNRLLERPPDSAVRLDSSEAPAAHAERFVARLRGFLAPAESGDYYFYIAADDQGELWLSADETREKLALAVKTDTYSNQRAWDREKRRSQPVRLEKGRHYAFEALMREGERNDHLSVAWSLVARDEPEIIAEACLRYAATDGFTPQDQEAKRQIESDLQRALENLGAPARALAEGEAKLRAGAAATAAAADEFEARAAAAKEALRVAGEQLKAIDAALKKLKSAAGPGAKKP